MPRIGTPDFATAVPSGRVVTAGQGLLGGGDLSQDRELTVDFGDGHGQVRHADDPIVAGPRAWELYTQPVGPGPGQVPTWSTSDGAYIPGDVVPSAHAATHAATGSDPLDLTTLGAVPSSLRGPIGGIATPAYAATMTLDATQAGHVRIAAAGNLTLNPPEFAVDGQRLLVEVSATAGPCLLAVTAAFETSGAAPARSTTIPAGGWGYLALLRRVNTWRLVGMDPRG